MESQILLQPARVDARPTEGNAELVEITILHGEHFDICGIFHAL